MTGRMLSTAIALAAGCILGCGTSAPGQDTSPDAHAVRSLEEAGRRFRAFDLFWAGPRIDRSSLITRFHPIDDYLSGSEREVPFLYGERCYGGGGEDAPTCSYRVEIDNFRLCDRYAAMSDARWFPTRLRGHPAALFAEEPTGRSGFGGIELYTRRTTVVVHSATVADARGAVSRLRVLGRSKGALPKLRGRLVDGKPTTC